MKASQRRNHLLACACLAVIALGAPSRAFAADTPYDVINRAAANSPITAVHSIGLPWSLTVQLDSFLGAETMEVSQRRRKALRTVDIG